MTRVQVDKGAIPFVLRGADVKCPGLTSAGGQIDESVAVNTPVVRIFGCDIVTSHSSAIVTGNFRRGQAACPCHWSHGDERI